MSKNRQLSRPEAVRCAGDAADAEVKYVEDVAEVEQIALIAAIVGHRIGAAVEVEEEAEDVAQEISLVNFKLTLNFVVLKKTCKKQ